MLRTTIARALENGRARSAMSELVARAAAPLAARGLVRRAHVPRGIATVTVGGATLGGSGKSRVAVAIAKRLAVEDAEVVLVGHAYRARPARARLVSRTDAVEIAGDEAIACAAELEGAARVVVAPRRQEAIDFAAALRPRPDVLVFDGPLQLAPVRASFAVLAVDADEPWGSGAVFPAGDLRAPVADLVAQADAVVRVDARPRGLACVAGLRLGWFVALARPHRLARALATAELAPVVTVEAPDHGPVPGRAGRVLATAAVDAWIATPKCAVHLRDRPLSAPLVVLDATLPETEVERLPTWRALTLSELPP